MDLSDLWQEHKKFIIAVAGALVILLIGRGVVYSQHPAGDLERSSRSILGKLRQQREVADQDVRELREEVEALRERLRELVREMEFVPDPVYVLPANEPNPTSYCWKTIREMQEVRDAAERLDIAVPENLGLADAAPNDVQEIQRTLRALNVIYHVVVQCMDAGVRRISSIEILRASQGAQRTSGFVQEIGVEFEIEGSERSLRNVLAGIVDAARHDEGPYLEIGEPTEIHPHKQIRDLRQLRLTVSALSISISTEDLGLETG